MLKAIVSFSFTFVLCRYIVDIPLSKVQHCGIFPGVKYIVYVHISDKEFYILWLKGLYSLEDIFVVY